MRVSFRVLSLISALAFTPSYAYFELSSSSAGSVSIPIDSIAVLKLRLHLCNGADFIYDRLIPLVLVLKDIICWCWCDPFKE